MNGFIVFLAWMLGASNSAFAVSINTQLPFDIKKDALCFGNSGFTGGSFPLQNIANGYGACQGMVGLSRAFKLYARFRCDGEKLNRAQVLGKITQLRQIQRQNCSQTVDIPGYCSLKDLCYDHRGLLESQAIDVNAELAVRKILPDLPYLLMGATRETPKRNVATLQTLLRELRKGRYPLMHYAYHVVMVTGLKIVKPVGSDGFEAVLTLYNPNYPDTVDERRFKLNADMSETINEQPVFPLIPETSLELPACNKPQRYPF